MRTASKNLPQEWLELGAILPLKTGRDYDRAVSRMYELLDQVGNNSRHPLYGLLDTLGTVIHAYEEQHMKLPNCSGGEMLKYFMEERGVTQSQLSEIGSQGVVSEILNGKRELNVRQIRALAKRFSVSPAVFV